MLRYRHVQYQKKLMIQSCKNLVTDRQTDAKADGQTEESDFIGQCPTNVEQPTWKFQDHNVKLCSHFQLEKECHMQK